MRSSISLSIILPFVTTALTACSGGSDGGSGRAATSAPADAWYEVGYNGIKDDAAAAAYAKSAEFRAVNVNCAFYACDPSEPAAPANQSSPYLLANIHYAQSAGLKGRGTMVAIVDGGFRTDHQEFAGKPLQTFGTLPVGDHGTHVAGLIAASDNGVGMLGVAPDANLHLSAYDTSGTNILDIVNVVGATRDAASKGAVAQNNSWGFEAVNADDLASYRLSHPDASLASSLNALASYGTANWSDYLDALRTFQKTGVVVFSSSNNETWTSGSLLPSLPTFDTTLADAWISVVNGYFEVDSNHKITDAVRLSAPCGQSAAYCLAGDGTTWSAHAGSPSDYGSGTGTSYVAPQVSGSVALLAEAFPDLTAEEWTDRLLASANNDWFGAQGVSQDGAVDFGHGISHAYSNEWGHGTPDVKAALEPIGSVAIVTGSNVATADRIGLEDATVTTTRSYGDSFERALSETEITVFDALNGDFQLSARDLIVDEGAHSQGYKKTRFAVSQPAEAFATFSYGYDESRQAVYEAAVGFAEDPASHWHGRSGAGASSLFSVAENVIAVESGWSRNNLSIGAMAFSSEVDAADWISGASIKFGYETSKSNLTIGVSQIAEQNGLLGLTGSQAFDLGDGSASTAWRLDLERNLSDGISAFVGAEYGVSRSLDGTAGLVADMSDVQFSGFRMGLSKEGLWKDHDDLTFAVAQPMRVEAGKLSLCLPSGRTKDGTILYENQTVELGPSGRQLDFSAVYSMPMGASASFALGGMYSLDSGHVSGMDATSLSVDYRLRF